MIWRWIVLVAIICSFAPATRAAGMKEPDPAPNVKARVFLASIQASPELQAMLDEEIAAMMKRDSNLRRAGLRVALIDMSGSGPPQLAHYNGNTPVYPASVVKFVYLMAIYAWQEQGIVTIDKDLENLLVQMTYRSSNVATQKVVARLTDTTPGPELSPEAYEAFKEQRLLVKEWLATLGITDLHCVHPTYNGGGDLHGREVQFLQDRLDGALPKKSGTYSNRQAMTAIETAELLALLANNLALSPESSAEVRRHMARDPKKQPYLAQRIAGGAARVEGMSVYSKTGTWGPIFADAGVIEHTSGRKVALAVFVDAAPAYRGNVIRDLAHMSARHLQSGDADGK
jgi:hypothetical protein